MSKQFQGSKKKARKVAFLDREIKRKEKLERNERLERAVAKGDFPLAVELMTAQRG